MLNVKVTRLQPVVSQNANKLRAIADIEIGNGLMIYGLLYKLNKDNEFYVQMPQHIGRDGDYHSTVEPLSKEFAARIKSEVEKANIEGKNYTPTSEESEPLRFTFNMRNGANGSVYGNMRINDDLLVHNISVKDRLDAETGNVVKFISLPSKQADNGQWWSVVRPSNDTVKEAINHYGISAIGKIAVETVGNIKYKDLNGDGKIDEDDRTRVGRGNRPELTYGLNLNCAWNGFDLSAQFTGGALFDVSLTGTYYNGYDDNTVWTQAFKEGANSPLYLVQNAYTVENPNGTFPRLTLGNQGHGGDNGLASTFWLRNGRYLRLKSVQLGYTFPKRWMSPVGIQNLRIYVEGSNLFTISGLPDGIDPESPGVNNGYYPQQRTIMGGITLTF